MYDHLISTVATEKTCHCGITILTALDSGSPARVDAAPLPDRPAELTALIEGRWTYTRLHCGWLAYRDASTIAAPPATGTVHQEHRCRPRPIQTSIYDLSIPAREETA